MSNHQADPGIKSPSGIKLLRGRILKHRSVEGGYTDVDGARFYKIENTQLMRPFFMSLISGSNHWAFIGSTGAITAGRKCANSALFPYYSSDKLLDLVESTGPLTVVQIEREDGSKINWTPFSTADSARVHFDISRNLYKNISGSEVIFEEQNHSLGLLFRYSWRTGDRFGFIRNCHLANFGSAEVSLRLLDGLRNIMPSGLEADFQLRFSNLGDAYKKSERILGSPLSVFYLSSIPSDRAEPSEGLRSSVVWQNGLASPTILLSSLQLESFLSGRSVVDENEIRGQRGCYLTCQSATLHSNDSMSWSIVADVDQDQTDVVSLVQVLKTTIGSEENLAAQLKEDFEENQNCLRRIIDSADGSQCSGIQERVDRHLSNVTFNVMRGGAPVEGYRINISDFVKHLGHHNRELHDRWASELQNLAGSLNIQDLVGYAESKGDIDFSRIAREYLPLAFSRRHGDPTRPWNIFSIDTRHQDGSIKLNYQGNWRDIFQNWEALGLSFPRFLNAMLLRFVNASTIDGNNPYRLTKDGFDWERPDPNDPWSNIGYWGDHQIIYQLKLIEHARSVDPASLDRLLGDPACVYANVPYRIGTYQQMLVDSRNTIEYDFKLESTINERASDIGSDGQLLRNADGDVIHVSLFEKLLLSGIVKAANLVPEAGIWLNTQRPEWNDANNALVGIGTSVVTACHLRRYFSELGRWIPDTINTSNKKQLQISVELFDFVTAIESIYHSIPTTDGMSDQCRRSIVDQLQSAATSYRQQVYTHALSGEKRSMSAEQVSCLAQTCIDVLDRTISINQREDKLFHSYNLISFTEDAIQVDHLYEMLEGQVAAISSGYLTPRQSVEVLDALRSSRMYRQDQHSFMLYPDRRLPTFLEKNIVAPASVESSELLSKLLILSDASIIRRDAENNARFNGDFRNAGDVRNALSKLHLNVPEIDPLLACQIDEVCSIFEQTFDHARFTGRSGTFFGYEGLGSIYWHMVSKLSVAVVENFLRAEKEADQSSMIRLKKIFSEVQIGLGSQKQPNEYGAFPIDPYSHTPWGAGVKQPGMTGQVKEDILTRFAELGLRLVDGQIQFETSLLQFEERLSNAKTFTYFDVMGNSQSIELDAGELAFTYAQVPIVYAFGNERQLTIYRRDGQAETSSELSLSKLDSALIFDRSGEITSLRVQLITPPGDLLFGHDANKPS